MENVMVSLIRNISCAVAMILLLSGCSTNSPYEKFDNWVIRQNAVPRHFADYDLFFIYPTLLEPSEGEIMNWTKHGIAERVFDYTAFQTIKQFSNKVRVFAPFVHQTGPVIYRKLEQRFPQDVMKSPLAYAVQDTINALQFYLEHYHKPGRPYVLYAQEQGARVLYEALKRCETITPESGFVAAYFSGLSGITQEQIRKDFEERGIHPATGEYDTSVIALWNISLNAHDTGASKVISFSINPLNWQTDSTTAPASQNVFSIFYDPWAKTHTKEQEYKEQAYCGASISEKTGLLTLIPNPSAKQPPLSLLKQPQFGIFSGNLIANAEKRVKQYIYKNQWQNDLPPAVPAPLSN